MKPLLLEMQAFGPFARLQVIDFSLLGTKTFFLIHGPTGSGKTSILDAMCFALFGDSSGDERTASDLRSQHAEAGMLTQVRFTFSLGGRRYRVLRMPEQTRPALRGGGQVRQSLKAELVELDPDGETERPLAAGWEKVTREVGGLLGFDSRQFRQVIVLPQGRFFDFLKSGSQDREKILQVLFGTEMYRRMEDALKQAAKDLGVQAEACETQRRTLLDQAQAANVEELQGRHAAQANAVLEAVAAAASALTVEEGAGLLLQQAQQLWDRFAEHDAAQGALAKLEALEPAQAEFRAECEAARRALGLQAWDQARLEALRGHDKARAEREHAEAAQAQAVAAQAAAEAALAARQASQAQIDGLAGRAAVLEGLRRRVGALDQARAAAHAASEAAGQARQEYRRAEVAANASAQALQTLLLDMQAAAIGAAPEEGLALQVRQLTAQQEVLARRARRQLQLRDAEALRSQRELARQQAVERRDQAARGREATMQRWLAGQAARIAHQLVAGEPCVVCGSTEHPAPALHGDLVSDEALQQAERELEAAEAVRSHAEQAWGEADRDVSRIAGSLDDEGGSGETDAAALAQQVVAAQSALEVARQAAQALERLKKAEPQAHDRSAADAQACEASARAVQAAEVQAAGAQATLREREAEVPVDFTVPGVLDAEIARIDNGRQGLVRALTEATQAAQAAATAAATAQATLQALRETEARALETRTLKASEFEAQLGAAGFDTEAAYVAARREADELARLEAAVQAHQAAIASARDRAKRAGAEVSGADRPDKAAAEAAFVEARAARVAAAQAATLAEAELKVLAGYVASLERIGQAHQGIEERFRVLRDLADKATGQNARRMSFQRYVLATLLDEVVAATTQRLKVMSRGRYEMRRRLEAGDARAAGGLDLEVFDHYTGHSRGIQTLSGGESFLASLALALGLSDVVQSYAGGIRLDAIFVDEGFGTLDPEALDFAIRTLKDLQQAGRMVGIISHVSELKGWIDARLEVRPSQAGSEASFVV